MAWIWQYARCTHARAAVRRDETPTDQFPLCYTALGIRPLSLLRFRAVLVCNNAAWPGTERSEKIELNQWNTPASLRWALLAFSAYKLLFVGWRIVHTVTVTLRHWVNLRNFLKISRTFTISLVIHTHARARSLPHSISFCRLSRIWIAWQVFPQSVYTFNELQ